MVRNYIFNDTDLVQPTQYPTSKKFAKMPPPAPGPRGLGYLAERLTAYVSSFLIGAHEAL
jgi:hypothetical protein